MTRIKVIIPFLALALLIPPGLVNAQIEPEEDLMKSMSYTLEEIEHSFAVMEEYVIYDENKNITFDVINATRDHHVTKLDIDIALDFAIHSNDIINARSGALGHVNELDAGDAELQRALQELEDGKFRALFGGKAGSVGTVNGITFTTYEQISVPIISAFGVSHAEIHQARHTSSSNLVCGGSFQNPHPEPKPRFKGFFSTENIAKNNLVDNGYHKVSPYASWNYGNDYAKDVSAHGCDDSEMRSQAVVVQLGSIWRHSTQSPEPNPEVLAYSWPVYWWGPYAAWWHVRM